MNDLQIFKNNKLGRSIRVLAIDGEPWFVAKDIAEILGYKNISRDVQRHCKAAKKITLDRSTHMVLSSDGQHGGARSLLIIPERDVYRLIMRSTLPEAEQFEEWVVGEVLPSIRKTSGYVVPGRAIDFVKAWMPALDESNQGVVAAMIEANNKLLSDVDRMAPKEDFYDRVTQSETWLDMSQVAKLLKYQRCGRNNLLKFLRRKNVLRFNNNPYQQYVERGYFKIVEMEYIAGGEVRIGLKTVASQKGVDYINKLLKEES